MAKLHTHYVTNAKSELKFAYNALSKDQFQNEIQESLSHPSFIDDYGDNDDDISDYDNDDDDDLDEGVTGLVNNKNLEISNWINVSDKELQEILQTEVSVVISPPPPMNHGSQEFDMEEMLDRVLT